MKCSIIVVLLSALCCEAILFDFDPKPIFRRQKREVSSYTTLREVRCVEGCTIGFKSKLDTVKQAMHAKFSFLVNDFLLSKRGLDKTCLSYDQMTTCYDQCNAQSRVVIQLIAKVTDMLSIFETVCNSRKEEFVGYFPCYTKSKQLLKEQCAEKYGDPETFDSNLKSKVENLPVNEHFYSKVNSLMDSACNYLSRYQRCQTKVITEQCTENGEDAAEMLFSLHKQAFKAVSGGLKTFAPQIVIPEDCTSRDVDQSSPSETNWDEQSETEYNQAEE
jgi:hypothetical protein